MVWCAWASHRATASSAVPPGAFLPPVPGVESTRHRAQPRASIIVIGPNVKDTGPEGDGASLRLQVPPDPRFGRYVRERVVAFAASLQRARRRRSGLRHRGVRSVRERGRALAHAEHRDPVLDRRPRPTARDGDRSRRRVRARGARCAVARRAHRTRPRPADHAGSTPTSSRCAAPPGTARPSCSDATSAGGPHRSSSVSRPTATRASRRQARRRRSRSTTRAAERTTTTVSRARRTRSTRRGTG